MRRRPAASPSARLPRRLVTGCASALGTASLVALVAALALAVPARADTVAKWDGISARIGTSMRELQRPDGSLQDYLSTREPYAEAMVGYGLLLRGMRTGERASAVAGLRAVSHAVDPGVRGGPMLESVFKQLAVAAAYRVASTRLAGDPAFEARREAWAAWLRRVRPVHLTSETAGASNKHLVEAVADLELLGSGIGGGEPGSVLADPAGTLARVRALVGERWPAIVEAQLRPGPAGEGAVVSDGPVHPLAYHGLSLAMLDRAAELLGAGLPPTTRAARRAMARASWTLTAPDGDLAYWGRSHEQSWALALTAAGADGMVAASPADAARADALRRRLAQRIGGVHGFGPYGVWIVPALRTDGAAGRAALDDYAANGVYNGLTLVGAEWTLADIARDGAAPARGRLAADHGGAWRLGRGIASFAVARRGDVWFAVRMRGGFGPHRGDPRYTFGLMAAKRRVGGAWRDIGAALPRSRGSDDAAGPWLRLDDGTLAEPFGTRIDTGRDGTVVVRGGFRAPSGLLVRGGVRFTFAPTATGVAVSFPARAGDEVELADFRPEGATTATPRVRIAPRRGSTRVLHGSADVRAGYASAIAGPVVRVGTRVSVPRRGTLTWTPR
jgi:hypothetical protein